MNREKIDENLIEDQFGFRKNRGTREAILCLRSIVQKSFTVNKKVCIAFVGLWQCELEHNNEGTKDDKKK